MFKVLMKKEENLDKVCSLRLDWTDTSLSLSLVVFIFSSINLGQKAPNFRWQSVNTYDLVVKFSIAGDYLKEAKTHPLFL